MLQREPLFHLERCDCISVHLLVCVNLAHIGETCTVTQETSAHNGTKQTSFMEEETGSVHIISYLANEDGQRTDTA